MKLRILGCLAGLLVLTGCSTTSMKGTPFYTGEYGVRKGPASNRVNLWPLLYYRDPALSVLWPLMESSPEHLAVRPVYSVYDRNTDHPVYNVLWPIARFDPANQNYRVFPVFWGDEYFNVVPLYWHEGDPFSGVGHNALVPFWIWNSKENGDYLSVFWPLYARHRFPDHEGWRLWPLYGTSRKGDRNHTYAAWPFIHAYSNAMHSGHVVIPFYSYQKQDGRTTFLSLPYSRSRAENPGATSWDLTLPLCYREWTGERFRWQFYPALSWGAREGDMWNYWFALGMGRSYRSTDRVSNHVVPLYYYNRERDKLSFYTLPWWKKNYSDGSGWEALLPVYYRSHFGDEKAFYSLPWWSKTYMDGSSWQALFPLYYRSRFDDATAFYSLPWFSKKHADGSGWSTSIPFYFHSHGDGSSTFYSLPWLSEKHEDGSAWQAAFPFYYGSSTTNGSFMMTPLYARKRHGDGSLAWQCIIPLVYLNESYDAHFLTPLGGRWQMGDRYNWLALPLLSGGAKDADSGRNIWLAGLAGQHWQGDFKSHYIFPLYYSAPYTGEFYSLPYAAWRKGDRKTHALPLLLSGWHTEGDASGSILLAGLAGHRSGTGDSDYNYVFPLYYRAPERGTFISLPYAAWESGMRDTHLVPPLLSGWYSEGDASGAFLLLGLAGYRGGDEKARNYIFPLYYSAPPKDKFISLPYAAWRSGGVSYKASPLLLTGRGTTETETKNVVAGGLAYWSTDRGTVDYSHILPFYMWERDRGFYTLLFGKDQRVTYYATPLVGRYGGKEGGSGSWVFPVYWHRRAPSGDVRGNYLLIGYYRDRADRSSYGAFGLYDRTRWEVHDEPAKGQPLLKKGKSTNYLIFIGQNRERWEYEPGGKAGAEQLKKYSKNQYIFPLWSHDIRDKASSGERLETSSVLGFLYDTRHEEISGEMQHDYLRRRVLWRLYHYEKLNGDMSADIFPAITVDSYKSGYYKFSMLWRLFRYEKDPEQGTTKLDVLFVPIRR